MVLGRRGVIRVLRGRVVSVEQELAKKLKREQMFVADSGKPGRRNGTRGKGGKRSGLGNDGGEGATVESAASAAEPRAKGLQ